ncbi:unnamed protein product [marine sediment metagenome]|uniref:Uncharacterized protein n=1 Tax=marine sediment metagenome TaxID=412755 RepID=X0YEA5_9ZZZZ
MVASLAVASAYIGTVIIQAQLKEGAAFNLRPQAIAHLVYA